MNMKDVLADLMEIRKEITNVNRNAGQTIFNPAATEALDAIIDHINEKEAQ